MNVASFDFYQTDNFDARSCESTVLEISSSGGGAEWFLRVFTHEGQQHLRMWTRNGNDARHFSPPNLRIASREIGLDISAHSALRKMAKSVGLSPSDWTWSSTDRKIALRLHGKLI